MRRFIIYFLIGLFTLAAGLTLTGCAVSTSIPTNTENPPTSPVPGIVPTENSDQLQALGPTPQLTGKIVYQSNGIDQTNIFVLDLSSGENNALTTDNNSIQPSWSPDGKQIAYTCGESADQRQVCLMDADGNNKQTLTDSPGTKWGVNWSSDGKQIAYVSNEIPFAHIFILDLASKETHPLLQNPKGNDSSPRWSPDGQWIAFASDRKGFNLFKVKPDGSGEQQISDGNTDDRPAWSPDGKSILFRRIAKESSLFNGNEIMQMDADGNNVKMLTDNRVGDDWPSYSKDGKWILFTDEVKESFYQILVMPAEGGLPARITQNGILGTAPDWTD